ncbi:unnamed protein product, partial [Mesorhabditis belari]|uniref:Cerebral cavernous malformations 2 harmonin-homology domain-containing protein n=1 Tax=Mesorhabditis belari TaxID=2138241 RepID=A0AAF3FNA6_9BILA
MAVPHIELPTRFQVMFGGVIPGVDHTNLDPSGRSDLLRTIDKAKDGLVYLPQRLGEFRETAKLQMDEKTLSVLGLLDGQLELRVSLHQIASIGYVREEISGHFIHILCVKVGEVHKNPSIFDLAIMYCRTKEIAEAVCECASNRFQRIYREALITVPSTVITRNRLLTESRTASSPLVDDLRSAATPPRAPSASTASTVNTSLANDYIQELASCLSTNELREFAELIGRWQVGDLPVRELTLKLIELYGPERRQALTKLGALMAEQEQEEFYSFLAINGVQVDLDFR